MVAAAAGYSRIDETRLREIRWQTQCTAAAAAPPSPTAPPPAAAAAPPPAPSGRRVPFLPPRFPPLDLRLLAEAPSTPPRVSAASSGMPSAAQGTLRPLRDSSQRAHQVLEHLEQSYLLREGGTERAVRATR